MFRFDLLSHKCVRVLSDLLIVDWHQRHEDVASALQQLSDPLAVPALRQAAELDLPYLAYDQDRALSRKCMWALSDIRTHDAAIALESLALSSNDTVRDLAVRHLAKIHNSQPRAPGSRRSRRE
jgi:HEAT repeat protein